MDQVNWGMIGCGDVTEVKSGPAFNKIAHSQLVGVMRRDADKARNYAARHGVPLWTTEANELLNHPNIQAIYVATPPDTHAHYTIAAAQAGKAVYVEKPMARTMKECEQMITACEAAQVPLFVAYYRRCLPSFLKVKQLVDDGAIGTIRSVHVQMLRAISDSDRAQPTPWRLRPELAGGGHFVDLASHQLDFLDFLFGPVTSVAGWAVNQARVYPAEDNVSATFQFTSGVMGTGSWCFAAAPGQERDSIDILGSTGRITFATFKHDVPLVIENESGRQHFHFEKPPHIQQALITTVVAALRGEGTCPSTGTTGARTTWIMDKILETYRQSLRS